MRSVWLYLVVFLKDFPWQLMEAGLSIVSLSVVHWLVSELGMKTPPDPPSTTGTELHSDTGMRRESSSFRPGLCCPSLDVTPGTSSGSESEFLHVRSGLFQNNVCPMVQGSPGLTQHAQARLMFGTRYPTAFIRNPDYCPRAGSVLSVLPHKGHTRAGPGDQQGVDRPSLCIGGRCRPWTSLTACSL